LAPDDAEPDDDSLELPEPVLSFDDWLRGADPAADDAPLTDGVGTVGT
jgi:hypothetical protein